MSRPLTETTLIRIERGNPDDIELAALLVVLLAAAETAAEPDRTRPAPVLLIHPAQRIGHIASHSWVVAA